MFDFGVDGLGKNVIVGGESKGELEMKKYELSALEDFGTKEDLETLLEVMRGLRDDVNGELNDSCVAGVRLVSVRAVDAPGAANYFRRARKDIDERTGLVRLSEIETNELFDKEIGVVVPYLSLRAYIKTGEKGLFARQMEKAQREVMKDFEK